MRRLSAAVALLLLSSCAHAASQAVAGGAHYVNMGSSFAAGAGLVSLPPESPHRCYQSTVNYARLLAQRLALRLDDVSCGGATSAHLLTAWNELPAQIDAVTSDTRLVTITIGGNDVAYAGNLTAASCEQGETINIASMTLPCPSRFPVAENAYANLERNLQATAAQIFSRAPQARVVFIQYVTLVPQTQCAQSRLTDAEAAELRAVALRLADATARAARSSGASALRIDKTSSAHTPCDADPWSVGLPADYRESMGAPWHPNQRGMEAIASALEAMVAH